MIAFSIALKGSQKTAERRENAFGIPAGVCVSEKAKLRNGAVIYYNLRPLAKENKISSVEIINGRDDSFLSSSLSFPTKISSALLRSEPEIERNKQRERERAHKIQEKKKR